LRNDPIQGNHAGIGATRERRRAVFRYTMSNIEAAYAANEFIWARGRTVQEYYPMHTKKFVIPETALQGSCPG